MPRQGEIERHLALVAANHMITAVDLWPNLFGCRRCCAMKSARRAT